MTPYEKRCRAQAAEAIVGVDAGKRKHALAVRPRGLPDSDPYLFETTREGFEAALETVHSLAPGAAPSSILFGVEFAGSYGITFAHFLRDRSYQVVTVLGAHSSRWKEVVHNQRLKSDPKDSLTIVDLAAQGHFVSFPFLEQVYADLRYLVSHRERLAKLRGGAMCRLKDVLHVVWPEFDRRFDNFCKKTPIAILRAFPGAHAFAAAPKRKVVQVIDRASRGHLGEDLYQQLLAGAEATVGLAGAQEVLQDEVGLLLELLAAYDRQIAAVEEAMVCALRRAPEAKALLSIPKLGPVTAAVFLGSIGDPRAYESSRQALRVGGLSLVVQESGLLRGKPRLSKRGRPEMRRQAYMFAVRSVMKGGLYREAFDRALAENPQKPKKKILVALARRATKLMFSVARDRRLYTPEPPK